MEALDRVMIKCGRLSPGARKDYVALKGEWDKMGVRDHTDEWPDAFLKLLKRCLNDAAVDQHAFHKFMYHQFKSKLGHVRALTIPGS